MEALSQKPFVLWTGLRGLGNSAAVKATVFIPVIGYLILFNDAMRGAIADSRLDLGCGSGGQLRMLDTEVRLYILYYGMTCLAIGSLLFRACPPIVRDNATDAEYVLRIQGLYSDQRIPSFLDELHALYQWLKSHRHYVPAGETELLAKALMEVKDKSVAEIRSHHLPDLLTSYFSIENHLKPRWRIATALFFCLGFGLLAVPALDMFLRVTFALMDLCR